MNVASLELCKQLYELSDWVDTSYIWHVPKWRDGNKIHEDHNAAYIVFAGPDGHDDGRKLAYDLGYLLRKLPQKLLIGRKHYAFLLTGSTSDETWVADYYLAGWQQPLPGRGMEVWMHWGDRAKLTEADTPEDAVAKLAIALFEQGVLHKEGE